MQLAVDPTFQPLGRADSYLEAIHPQGFSHAFEESSQFSLVEPCRPCAQSLAHPERRALPSPCLLCTQYLAKLARNTSLTLHAVSRRPCGIACRVCILPVLGLYAAHCLAFLSLLSAETYAAGTSTVAKV